MYKDPQSQRVFIGYGDGTINYFDDPQEIGSITDIRRSTTFTSKGINDFESGEGRLFVATDFGIQTFDLETLRPLTTISKLGNDNQARVAVNSITIAREKLWVSMGSRGLFSASLTVPNLADPSVWTQEDTTDGFPDETVFEVATLGNKPYARLSRAVYTLMDTGWAISPRLNRQLEYIDVQDGYLSAGRLDYFISFQENEQNVREVSTVSGAIEHALITEGKAYVSTLFEGIKSYDYEERTYTDITPSGPSNNRSFRIAAGNGEFYIAPRGHNETGAPIGDGSGIYYYNNVNNTWKILSRDNEQLPSDRVNINFARAIYDANSRTAYLGSWSSGLAVLRDGELIESYTCENSELNYILANSCNPVNNNETRVSGMGLDSEGNLWVSMSLAQRPLAVRRTDGTWLSYENTRFPGGNFFDLIVDDFNSKWMVSRLTGVFVFNENGTLENNTDDAIIALRSGAGQGDLQTDGVRSIAKDQDNFIWVGTDKGITVFYDAFSISQGTLVDGACPAFERRCILREEQINSIEVDGGNRKWIGTNNGVFLVSPEGDEVILQFTTENSPLISDIIYDISIDGSTGEVFVATDKGVISYQGDATDPSERCDDVIVYPSPVRPEYDGIITIRGAAANSIVRITSVSGLLVREITAQGGTATWDGRDVYGNKVSSGIYLAIVSNDDGEQGCIGKFSVLR